MEGAKEIGTLTLEDDIKMEFMEVMFANIRFV
jgi:hypothetical protein